MKSSWIGIGFSHHSVPSLSNTATRSSTGTGAEPSAPVTRATNPAIARFAGPSRQLPSSGAPLFTGHHRDGLALEVDVGLAADVDRDAVDGAAGERVRFASR